MVQLNLPLASEKCQQEKRKTVNGEDILFAMTSTGFENYAEALKIYLAKYREVSSSALHLFQLHDDMHFRCHSSVRFGDESQHINRCL